LADDLTPVFYHFTQCNASLELKDLAVTMHSLQLVQQSVIVVRTTEYDKIIY